jgi:alkylation response protein AidB-like acyl-CoA dehydrogenase
MCIVLGMAIGTLECFVEQVKDRKPFNLPYKTLGETPAMQLVAAKARATISAAQALLFSRADQLDRMSSMGLTVTSAVEGQFMMDFAYAGTLAGQAIDMLQLAVGSSTISDKNPIQRFARDARVALTHGSTRLDPLAEINGREILGQPPFSGFSGAIPGAPDKQGKTASGKELKKQ